MRCSREDKNGSSTTEIFSKATNEGLACKQTEDQ
jgi:hypothetical protein